MKGEEIMFDKFGEFDSYFAINEAAGNQLAEGDLNAVREIAKENGIDPDDAEDFIAGDIGELCGPLSAALGKFEIEKADLGRCKGEMVDYLEHVNYLITTDEAFRLAYRKVGVRLIDAFAYVINNSGMYSLPEKLSKRITAKGEVKCGDGRAEVCRKLRDYYLGGAADE